MKCPCRVGKHCAVQALPDICSYRSSTHSCTKTVHWLYAMLCSIFGPGYARPHILLQFSGIVLCPSLFDERLNAVSTTEKRQSTLMKRIPFNILFRAFFSRCETQALPGFGRRLYINLVFEDIWISQSLQRVAKSEAFLFSLLLF